MATNNQINTGLSGTTGSGSIVGATSPTLVTPTLGAATGTTLTFSPTTGGIVGTTTNDDTDAGNVGELLSSTVAIGSAVSMSNAVDVPVTTIDLTAGDWDIGAQLYFVPGAGVNVYYVTIRYEGLTYAYHAQSDTKFWTNTTGVPSLQMSASTSYNFASPTTVTLSSYTTFASGTLSAYGQLFARRAR